MSDTAHTTTLGLDHYARVLRRQWRLVVAAIAIGAIAAIAYLLVAPQRITATTDVNLSVITTDPFNPQRAASGLLDDATEAAIARSYVVAERAAALLGDADATREIHDTVDVTISEGGTIAHVSATAATRALAIERADSVAAAYLAYRSEQAESRLDVMVSGLSTRIDELDAQLAEANAAIADAGSGAAQATSDREQILLELEGLLSQRNALQSVDTSGGSVLTGAADNPIDSAPPRYTTAATGIGIGAIVGILLAFLREPFDGRLRSGAEITRALGARVLATLRTPHPRTPLEAPDAEAMRIARERMLADLPAGARAVAVLDDTSSEGAVATGLAMATAQSGFAVRLVLPHPSERRLAVLRSAGAAPRAAVPGLSVRFGRADLHGEARTAEARVAVESAPEGTLVMLAVPVSAGTADLLAALRLADAVVVVLQEGASRRTTAAALRDESATAGVPLIGAVVVPRERRRSRRRAGRREVAPAADETPAREEYADAV
ncbi:hypothetical protein GCM10017576_31520 [Microbacterium barkeri]|uniref:Subunit length determinant protein n=1 Tax=Microbacterium barkeri TaxID=33917 RepID=A0A9W6H627_9MICO|nr:hypothetical protein [Microbacterium barkeri]MDR6878026.1 capsular polysaccharide biosynthesis protein [Microbacterium barkeri]GLJ63021.1 hypothetical protein GCM10017576_31520 [Microbacterium barkeri]